MLEIINNLKPFFENCYARVNVRQYARLMRITPPTASTLLKSYEKHGLLVIEKDRNYIMFHSNRESRNFIMLSRIYWQGKLKELTKFIEQAPPDAIVLFGSLSKGETRPDSDIDLAIFGIDELDVGGFEKQLKRKIQTFWFGSLKEIKNANLRNNIINGHVLSGRLEL